MSEMAVSRMVIMASGSCRRTQVKPATTGPTDQFAPEILK